MIELDGNSLTMAQAEKIALGAPLRIAATAEEQVEKARHTVLKAIESAEPTYGVNTGFGMLASYTIAQEQLIALQKNLVLSHAAGWGEALSLAETRLAMALRLNVLLKGFTGVRFSLCKALEALLNAGILPVIPEYGSVGASGDLAPLAHLALPLLGEGLVHFHGTIIPAAQALQHAGISPITLAEKEGLSLVNGTQVMLAIGTLCLMKALRLTDLFDTIAALSCEALQGSLAPFDARVHAARAQPGQIASAAAMRRQLTGSYLHTLDRNKLKLRLQDPYSLRCAPQVHGASRDAFAYAQGAIETEFNAATDNPLVFVDDDTIISAGNFHGQPLALPFDCAAIAAAELGNISERRLELLLNPSFSALSPFLTPNPGLESGYMAIQYLAASLVNSNKLLTHPACSDSIPGNCGVEDHVSMGMTAANKLRKILTNLRAIAACELIAACQAVDLRNISPKNLGDGTKVLYNAVRAAVPPLTSDRIVSEDIAKAVNVIDNVV